MNDTATTEIYTLSLRDALPIWKDDDNMKKKNKRNGNRNENDSTASSYGKMLYRSEEHTSELQSHSDVVCRLLLEKKNGWFLIQDLARDVVYHRVADAHQLTFRLCLSG